MWPFKRKSKAKPSPSSFVYRDFPPEASALLSKRYPALDKHFQLNEKLSNTYTPSSESAVRTGVRVCKDMIGMAPAVKAAFEQDHRDRARVSQLLGETPPEMRPLLRHMGYQQLAIILERQGDSQGAIDLSRQAQQEGWNGDWPKRIARCQSKLAKSGSRSSKK